MIQYPLLFEAEAKASSGIQATWSSSAMTLSPVTCAIPKEFHGPGNGYSPEDLMAMAVINCFIATFKVFAEKSGLQFQSIALKAALEINRNSSGTVGLSSIKVDVNLQGSSDAAKAKTILEETRKNCLMGNALKIQVDYQMRT